MTGQAFLDLLVGTNSRIGLLDANASDTAYRALVLEWLNLVLKDISNRQQDWHWRFLEKTATAPTVADQLDYDLPADIDTDKIFSVFDRTNNITYTYMEHDKFLRAYPNPSLNTGNPSIFTVWADVIKLYPIPSSVFTLFMKYIKTITLLADDSESTNVPAKYDTVIIDGVLMWAYKLDPQKGNSSEQARIYEYGAGGSPGNAKGGVQGMVEDNRMMISELSVTESHRTKGGGLSPFPVAD